MQIERDNPLGKAEAMRRIDTFVQELMGSQLPGGVQITDAEKQWNDNAMSFSFKASKGFLGATITGDIVVTEDKVTVTSTLPPVVRSFVGEERIASVITDHLSTLLS